MRFRVLAVVVLLAALCGLPAASASADSGSASYQYLIGTGVLCTLGIPNACPDVARAPNGDTIALAGQGTLSIHPQSVTGGGTFTHRSATGQVLGKGTWTALDLLAFQDYGPSTDPTFPATFRAGRALIRIHLSPAAGGPGFNGILEVTCHLPGAKVPQGGEEGIRLNVQGVANFHETVSGVTLFIRQP